MSRATSLVDARSCVDRFKSASAADEDPSAREVEDDLVLAPRGEVDLIEIARPEGMRLIAEHARERQIGPLPLESRAGEEQRLWVRLHPRAHVEVMEDAGRDDGADRTERVHLASRLGLERDGRMDEQPAVREARDRHARAALDAPELRRRRQGRPKGARAAGRSKAQTLDGVEHGATMTS
jgi:hypothetical protein